MINYLVAILVLASISVFGQDKLIVEYETFTKVDLNNITTFSDGNISNKEWENALKDAMSKPNYYKLILNAEESVFEFVEKVNNAQQEDQGRVMISFGDRSVFYKNLSEKISLKESNSWNVDYLITDSIKKYDWKITKETQEILGYETRKATAIIDSTKTVIAWYAPKLAFKNGPDNFNGLPGLILKAEQTTKTKDNSNQTRTFTAVSITVGDHKTKITRPKKGKKITQEQFKKESDEQMQKMKEMYGGGVDED